MPTIGYLLETLTPVPGKGIPGEWYGEVEVPGLDDLFGQRPNGVRLSASKISTRQGCVHANLPDDPLMLNQRHVEHGDFDRLTQVIQIHGGDGLGMLEVGQVLHLFHVHAPKAGGPPKTSIKKSKIGGVSMPIEVKTHGVKALIHWASLRLAPSAGHARNPAEWDELAAWLSKSRLKPDLAALRELFDAPGIDLPAWFAAFGLTLPPSAQTPSDAPIQPLIDQALRTFLREEAPDPKLHARLQAELGKPAWKRFPTRLSRKPGTTARAIAEEWIGDDQAETTAPVRAAIQEAAGRFVAIQDGPAADRLVGFGNDALGLLEGVALGRLFAHYDPSLLRDPIFLIVLANTCEAWNAHGYVEPLLVLAERTHRAGFTLMVFPATLETALQKRLGEFDENDGRESTAREGWAAEAIIDVKPVADPMAAARALLKAIKADGLLLRAEADGSTVLETVGSDPPAFNVDQARLRDAAIHLDPRAALEALGLPALLEPGDEATENSDEQTGTPTDLGTLCRLLGKLPAPTPVATMSALRTRVPEALTVTRSSRYVVRIRLPWPDAHYLRALEASTRDWNWGNSPLESRIADKDLWFHAPGIALRSLLLSLGDLPLGTTVAHNTRSGEYGHFVIDATQSVA